MGLVGKLASTWSRVTTGNYQYAPIPAPGEGRRKVKERPHPSDTVWSGQNRRFLKLTMLALVFVLVLYMVVSFGQVAGCMGESCSAGISHLWGQYSPVFQVPSKINPAIPAGCAVTFAQVLSRHGARDPTASRSQKYKETIDSIQKSTTEYGKGFEFLKHFEYTLGADELTGLGEKQMLDAGAQFYQRYKSISNHSAPFIRASGQNRVIQSAVKWAEGFDGSKLRDEHLAFVSSGGVTIIPEGDGYNNTLDHGLCKAFEDSSEVGDNAQKAWAQVFVPEITRRLNENLPGANLDIDQTIQMMDMCPMATVANLEANLSDFCDLFTLSEWKSYDYYQSLGKYYGYGDGNPLGPTQGVGWVNELVARLTQSPVMDHTSTNSTLDGERDTFPLDRAVYADFSHDNTMVSIYAALGLYDGTTHLSLSRRQSPVESGGFSASWTVPFAARMFVERMSCNGHDAELVRILVNDRVMPLRNCGADTLGRCTVDGFVESLSFARNGGDWDKCVV